MPKISNPKNRTRTVLLIVTAIVIIIIAVPAGLLYYFKSSQGYCNNYAEQNAKTPYDLITDKREREKTGLYDQCMKDKGLWSS
jgi:hypothetical protein